MLIHYPDEPEAEDEPARVTLRGHRQAPADRINYALVGAGAFGTAMLVPQMRKRADRYFLRGVVSRTGTQGSNFARDNQVEILTSDLDAVLRDPGFSPRRDRDAASRSRRSGRPVARGRQARVRREAARDLLGGARAGGERLLGAAGRAAR